MDASFLVTLLRKEKGGCWLSRYQGNYETSDSRGPGEGFTFRSFLVTSVWETARMVPESQGHSATRSTSQLSWPPSLPSAAARLRNRFPTNTGQLSPSVSTMVSTPAGRAPPCKNTKNKNAMGAADERGPGGEGEGKAGVEGGALTLLQGQDPRRRWVRGRPALPTRALPAPRVPPPPQTPAQASRDPRFPKFRFSKTLNLNAVVVKAELFAAKWIFKCSLFTPEKKRP